MNSPRCGVNGRKWSYVKSENLALCGRRGSALTRFAGRNYDEAIRVMQRATALPKNTKTSYHDQVRTLVVVG